MMYKKEGKKVCKSKQRTYLTKLNPIECNMLLLRVIKARRLVYTP